MYISFGNGKSRHQTPPTALEMNTIAVLAVALFAATADAQNFGGRRFFGRQFQPAGAPAPAPAQRSGGLYYSWDDPQVGRHTKVSWSAADSACRSRGQKLVSLETSGKNSEVVGKISRDNIKYIWTSGQRSGNGFVWGSGAPVQPLNWGRTGGDRKPQPDNRVGNENCLAILNKFYPGDGVTWHDVACHHKKPYVCE